MRTLGRHIFRILCKLYPYENGKYSLLQKVYFPYLAPRNSFEITTKIKDNILMKLDLTEYIQAYLYNFGSYELPTINYIKKTIKPNMNILDIGGNVGLMTLVFANQLNNTGKVYTFEPEPSNFKKLTDNVALNKFTNVLLNQLAVSDRSLNLKFYLSTGNNSGVHSLIYNASLNSDYIEVPAIKMDEYVIEHNIGKVDLIKIDVEGAELDVLNGMQSLLKKDKPIIIMEVVSEYLKSRNSSAIQFKQMMKSQYGYEAYLPTINGDLTRDNEQHENIGDNVIFI